MSKNNDKKGTTEISTMNSMGSNLTPGAIILAEADV